MPDLKISQLPTVTNPSLDDLIPTAQNSGTSNNTITVGTFRNNLFTQFPIASATRSAMSADLAGVDKWRGGTLGPDGKIYGIPYNTTDILIINPATNIATKSFYWLTPQFTFTNDTITPSVGSKTINFAAAVPNIEWTVGTVVEVRNVSYGQIPYILGPITSVSTTQITVNATNAGGIPNPTPGPWRITVQPNPNSYYSGVLAPNGKIYSIPSDSTDILIIDPVTGTATRSAMGADLTGANKWWGGVLAPNGKIYGIPYTSTDILIIDTVTNTATRSTMGATFTGNTEWVGGVLGPGGKIYGIPFNSTDILIIDTVTGTATRSSMGAVLTGSFKWSGGVLAPNGKIYGIPNWSTDILIIDPVAGTATRNAMGATLTGNGKWAGGIIAPNSKIYGIPYFSTDILIIDPITNTATRSTMGANLAGAIGKWWGGVFTPDGKIYGIPGSSTDILTITPELSTSRNIPLETCMSAYYNKF